MTTTPTLDPTELLHLALQASGRGDSEATLGYLKRAIALSDAAPAHFLLGAEYAQLGMIDRAIVEMQAAVECDPALSIAHFQLGLLWLTSGQAEAAIAAWAPLDALGDAHPLYQFKTGLGHLARDAFDEAERWLQQGLQSNRDNPALNQDMQRVLDEIARLRSQPPADGAAEEASSHVLISAYQTPAA